MWILKKNVFILIYSQFTYNKCLHNIQPHEPNSCSYPEGFAYLLECLFELMLPVHPWYFHCPLHFGDLDKKSLKYTQNFQYLILIFTLNLVRFSSCLIFYNFHLLYKIEQWNCATQMNSHTMQVIAIFIRNTHKYTHTQTIQLILFISVFSIYG